MATPTDLREDAGTIDYEVWMLMETAERLRGHKQLPVDEIARRAVVESCLLHARVLLEFFRTSETHTDDLRAMHFFDDGSPERLKIESLARSKDSWERKRNDEIHKALAHPVQNRKLLNTDWNEWDLGMVTSRLKTFYALLEPERRSWFPRSSNWFVGALDV